MKRIHRGAQLLLVILMLTFYATSAQAVLQAVGPTDPVTTLPTWYQDTSNLALQPCLDQNGFCILPPPFAAPLPPATPITTTGPISDLNFPNEIFYYIVDSSLPVNGLIGGVNTPDTAAFRMALEASFLAGVFPGGGQTFLRLNLQRMVLTPNSTFTVTHPYGTFQFSTDAQGKTPPVNGQAYRVEDPVTPVPGVFFPPDMQQGTKTHIGPFLRPLTGLIVDPLSGHTYIGDAVTPVPVTGSPNGTNFLRIDGPNINPTPGSPGYPNSVSTDLFTLAGRVFTGAIARPLTIDRATYARDAVGGQVDIFVTSLTGATIQVAGTGIPTTILTPDTVDPTKYFCHIPFIGSTLPSGLVITNSLDLVTPVPHPVTLVDEIIITSAVYNPDTKIATIKAISRDTLAPLPTLNAVDFAVPNVLDAAGFLAKTLTGNPPPNVTVISSKGGSDIIPISVVAAVPPPVAVNDSASTAKGAAVTISVIANDTTAGVIDPASVAIVAAPASGATAVPAANGTVVYTPTATFTGSETFTYTVKDTLGQISNAATVTVIVNAPPVAGNDTATAAINSTVGINVIANDTASNSSINSTTVNIVSLATCGTTNVLTTGVVQFTAPATVPAAPGTCSFSYVVSDTFVPSAISNVATVTVTITPPVPPVALNDTAAAFTSATTVINVIANDTSSTSTLNPASIVVTVPTGGTAVANLNGTVSYTAPATPGIYSFTYTVKDNAVPPSTSNSATVTVTVTAPFAPPTAVNDSATVVAGSSVVINVAANDIAGTNPINPLTVSSVTVVAPPVNGTAVVNIGGTGTVTYTPAAGFNGTDSFTYNIKDTLGNVSATNATVAVTITTPLSTETISITRAQYTLSSGQWRIDGTTTARVAGQTMKIFNSPTVPADAVTGLLATVNVAANGTFTWTSANGAALPNALRRVSVLSSINPNNNKSEQVTVTVR